LCDGSEAKRDEKDESEKRYEREKERERMKAKKLRSQVGEARVQATRQ